MEVLGFQYDVETLLPALGWLLRGVTVIVISLWAVAGVHMLLEWLTGLHDLRDRTTEHGEAL